MNLPTPSSLGRGEAELWIHHRFYTPLGRMGSTVWGDEPSRGANVGIGFRVPVGGGFEVRSSYSNNEPPKEITLGIAYMTHLRAIASSFSFGLEYYDFRERPDRRTGGLFALVSSRFPLLFRRVNPIFDIGYDWSAERTCTAAGFSIRMHPKVSLVVEVFSKEGDLNRPFAIGWDYRTYGHHFMLFLSNHTGNGFRTISRGAESDDFYVGFNLRRWLHF